MKAGHRPNELATEILMMNDFAIPGQPILLATDGHKDADAAVRVAARLSESTRRPVTVVAVLEPPPLVTGEYGFVVPVADVWKDRRDVLLDRVQKQIAAVAGPTRDWPIEVLTGRPPNIIARTAETLDAALIVIGLGDHGILDRALGSESALHTLRTARRPVLAVPPTCSVLPNRAVVGVDFSAASVAATQSALSLLPSLTDLELVHVAPRWDLQPAAYAEWRTEYERRLAPPLGRVIRDIDAPPGVVLTSAIREGNPTRQLLAAAVEYDADLIIVGSRGLGFLERLIVGSTATGIVRGAQLAVFAYPFVALGQQSQKAQAQSAGP
ncbi:MAG TPA: universal stress protein [Gemmatimonadaceae bacterium]|jgi:nucleotide-binding universal stress UspA family protein